MKSTDILRVVSQIRDESERILARLDNELDTFDSLGNEDLRADLASLKQDLVAHYRTIDSLYSEI